MTTALAHPVATAAHHRLQSAPPALERVRGSARLAVAATGGNRTQLIENYQAGAARMRFPRRKPDAPLETILINTAGGLTGGDSLDFSVAVGAAASAVVTTQAPERIYRRSAGLARIEANLTVESGASLDWLPQETIVFDRSALRRTLTAEVHPAARFMAVEAIILGRAAMGEQAKNVIVSDSWRIRRGGRLIFADGLRFDGDATEIMAGGATGNGATAMATVVLVAPDAEKWLDIARGSYRLRPDDPRAIAPTRTDDSRGATGARPDDFGASARGSVLVCRLVARRGQALRTDLVRLIESLRGAPMPRVWNC